MESWDLNEVDLMPRLPEILSSEEESRVVLLDLEADQELSEHQVYERAWVVVISGEVVAAAVGQEPVRGGPGTLLGFAPGERHEIGAVKQSRLLLILAPWPGKGHPGSLSMREKLYARRRAAKARAEREAEAEL